MSLGPDPSYSGQSRIYRKQQPDGQSVNGNTVTTEEVFDAGSLLQRYGLETLNGTILPASVSFTFVGGGGGATPKCVVTGQLTDNGGQNWTQGPRVVSLVLSANANGYGLGAASSAGVVFNEGTLLTTLVASLAFLVQVNANGQFQFTISDTAKTGYYIAVDGVGPLPVVSAQIPSTDYT